MVEVYAKRFSANMGAKAVNPHWVIGAFIIKHKLRLTDEGTLITLSEDIAGASGAAHSPKGKIKIDATVADQYIRYPTDLSLVNEARVKTERIIDEHWELVNDQLPVKPRTYRKVAQKRFLSQSKKKKPFRTSLRKTLRYLLNYVERNLSDIDQMLGMLDG